MGLLPLKEEHTMADTFTSTLEAALASLALHPGPLVQGTPGADVLSAGAWASNMVDAGEGDDTIVSGYDGRNADTLDGGHGTDTYILGAGWGTDTITDIQGASIVQFMDLRLDQLRFSTDAQGGLTVSYDARQIHDGVLSGGIDTLLIGDFSNSLEMAQARVQQFVFADGQTASAQEILALIQPQTTTGNDQTRGTGAAEQIDGLAGRDTLWGQAGNDTLLGGAGDDRLDGGLGDDLFDGGSGRDVLIDGEPLGGGTWGVHTSSDTYVLRRGGGADTVIDMEATGAGAPEFGVDTVRLGPGISPDEVQLTRVWRTNSELVSEDSLVIELFGRTDSLTVVSQFASSNYRAGIEQLVFDDGTVWGLGEIQSRVIDARQQSSESLESGTTVVSGNTIIGSDGDDRVLTVPGKVIDAGLGDDGIWGSSWGDQAGAAIRWRPGQGQDTVHGYQPGTVIIELPSPDKVAVSGGIRIESADQDGHVIDGTLILAGLQPGSGSLTLDIHYYQRRGSSPDQQAVAVRFTDGSPAWTVGDFMARLIANQQAAPDIQIGSPGHDTITGGIDIQGGGGDDLIQSPARDTLGIYPDTIPSMLVDHIVRYNLGDGLDTVKMSKVIVQLGAGLDPAMVRIRELSQGSWGGVVREVRFEGQAGGLDITGLYGIRFADGTVWGDADILANASLYTVLGPLDGSHDLSNSQAALNVLGGAGNDYLRTGSGNDTIRSGTGDDKVYAGGGNDIIIDTVGAGNVLDGEYGDDRIEGVGTLLGSEGNDTIIATGNATVSLYAFNQAPGHDEIQARATANITIQLDRHQTATLRRDALQAGEVAGQLTLVQAPFTYDLFLRLVEGEPDARGQATTASELVVTESGKVLLRIEGAEPFKMTLSNRLSQDLILDSTSMPTVDARQMLQLQGTDGADRLVASDDHGYALVGGLGNDTLVGGAGNDLLAGTSGDDEMSGGGGADTYLVAYGGGNDRIKADALDTVLIEGHALSNVRVGAWNRVDDTVSLSLDAFYLDTKTNVVFEGASKLFGMVVRTANPAEGVLTWDQVMKLAHYGDLLQGGSGADTLNGGLTNDTLQGGAGNDLLLGNAGDDVLYGEAGDDTMKGGLGDDQLVVDGGNDLVEGGEGADTYIFSSPAVAADTTRLTTVQADLADTLRFQFAVDFAASKYIYRANDTLELQLVNRNRTPMGRVMLNGVSQLSSLTLSDDFSNHVQVVDLIPLANQSQTGTAGADKLQGFVGQDYLDGGAGNDVLSGLGGRDSLLGQGGLDVLDGGAGNDTLNGGAGNDTLTGGEGADLYTFLGADDADLVHADGQDTLMFSGYSRTQMTIGHLGAQGADSVLLSLGGGNSVLLDQASTLDGLILKFNDGNATAWKDVMAEATKPILPPNLTLTGTAGKDTLLGGAGNDTLSGLAGNDTLSGGLGDDALNGGKGNDTYLFARGDGHDTITDQDSTWFNSDALKISNAKSSQLWFTRTGNSLDIAIIGTADKVTVQDWFASSANRIEKITALGDNKTLNLNKLNNLVTAMAGFSAGATAGTDLPANTPKVVTQLIATSWTPA